MYTALFLRNGKIIGRQHRFIKRRQRHRSYSGRICKAVLRFADRHTESYIYIQLEIDDMELISGWLTSKVGRKVNVTVPKRGDKLKYIKMAEKMQGRSLN